MAVLTCEIPTSVLDTLTRSAGESGSLSRIVTTALSEYLQRPVRAHRRHRPEPRGPDAAHRATPDLGDVGTHPSDHHGRTDPVQSGCRDNHRLFEMVDENSLH
jgi:hypothetical protein